MRCQHWTYRVVWLACISIAGGVVSTGRLSPLESAALGIAVALGVLILGTRGTQGLFLVGVGLLLVGDVFRVGPSSIGLGAMLVLTCGAPLLLAMPKRKVRVDRRCLRLGAASMALLLAIGVGTLRYVDITGAVRVLSYAGVLLMGVSAGLSGQAFVHRLMRAVVAAATAQSVLLVSQLMSEGRVLPWVADPTGYSGGLRATGFFDNPNAATVPLLLAAPLLASVGGRASPVLFALFGLGIFATQSGSGIVAFAVVTVAYGMRASAGWPTFRRRVLGVFLLGPLVASGGYWVSGQLERTLAFEGTRRQSIVEEYLSRMSSPVQALVDTVMPAVDLPSPHNNVFAGYYAFGIVGVTLCVLWYAALIRAASCCTNEQARALLLGVVAIAVHGLFHTTISYASLWLAVGCGIGISYVPVVRRGSHTAELYPPGARV